MRSSALLFAGMFVVVISIATANAEDGTWNRPEA
jgi:hypothetical protein